MSLENGTMSFSAFYLRDEAGGYAASTHDNLKRHVLPEIEATAADRAEGWVGPRHLLDRDLTLGNIAGHGWIHLHYVRATRKVPETLLQAACKNEERAEMRARGQDSLIRCVRAEIKQRVREALLARAQPTLDGIGVWIDTVHHMMLAEATTDGKIDVISPAFKEVFGTLPILATPETAAIKMQGLNVNDLDPVSYTPDVSRECPTEVCLGREFLTWLFWRYEKTGGVFRTALHGCEYGYMLEGPLTFYSEGRGAFEVSIRKGTPLNSREAMACLLEGKLLRKARFVMAQADKTWTCTVDDAFAFGSLRLPKGEAMDDDGRFAERTLFAAEFLDAWFALYSGFITERFGKDWYNTAAEIREWIATRNGTEA